MNTVFIRAMESDDKAAMLRAAIESHHSAMGLTRFEVNSKSFDLIPRSPFAYWTSETLRQAFAEFESLECETRTARQGLATADDFRFVRIWTEVSAEKLSSCWYPFAKGGAYSPFYSDIHLAVNWADAGDEIRNYEQAYIRNEQNYRRPGLTWPLRTQKGLCLRAMPAGCVFGHKGPAAFTADNDSDNLLALLAVTNSNAFRALVALQMAFGSYEVGVIQRTPVPELSSSDREALSRLAQRSWTLKRAVDTSELTSHAFVLPALLQSQGVGDLAVRVESWNRQVVETERALTGLQSEIDDRCFDLYGFASEDRQQTMGGVVVGEEGSAAPEDNADEDFEAAADAGSLAANLVDWLAGTVFGRFDIRLATGERQPPPEPEPFDPLPVCSPGMLTDDQGLPAKRAPEEYPLEFPSDGILVEDAGFEGDLQAEWDIVRRVRDVLGVVFAERATDIEAELCQLLGVRDMRSYLERPTAFFADHLSRYSKSRRKAPIYWPLSTASGNYTVWIYYPRLTEDTLYAAINEHVSPKISEVEERLTQLDGERDDAEGREATRIANRISDLAELLEELKALRTELQEVAALPYKPDLNDGVQVTAAPLWRLFRHRPWRNLSQKTWRELSEGKYDWAHLAYPIWPDRVRDKCKTDKSLAIAHGLQDIYEGEH